MLWNVELRQEPPSLKTEFPQHLVGTLNYHLDVRQTSAVERFEDGSYVSTCDSS